MRDFICPICQETLAIIQGSQIKVTDGYTVYCPNKKCRMSDWGHGETPIKAAGVFVEKCRVNKV